VGARKGGGEELLAMVASFVEAAVGGSN